MTAVLEPATVVLPPLVVVARRQQTFCPTCQAPTDGLLTECPNPTCVAADIAADVTRDRIWD